MGKVFWKQCWSFVMVAMLSVCFVSCGDDEKSGGTDGADWLKGRWGVVTVRIDGVSYTKGGLGGDAKEIFDMQYVFDGKENVVWYSIDGDGNLSGVLLKYSLSGNTVTINNVSLGKWTLVRMEDGTLVQQSGSFADAELVFAKLDDDADVIPGDDNSGSGTVVTDSRILGDWKVDGSLYDGYEEKERVFTGVFHFNSDWVSFDVTTYGDDGGEAMMRLGGTYKVVDDVLEVYEGTRMCSRFRLSFTSNDTGQDEIALEYLSGTGLDDGDIIIHNAKGMRTE